MANPVHLPEAWPQLLSREQLCAYLGGLSWDTVKKIVPVAPLDLGANVLRFDRGQIDAWIARLPPRLPRGLQPEGEGRQGEGPQVVPDAEENRPSAAALRARERALKGPTKWKRSPSSSASGARTVA